MRRVPAGKIAVPELPASFLERPALLAKLDGADPSQLVAVIAPAGFGKTLLLADWVRHGGMPTAWVTADRDDDSPRFWSAVLTALAALPTVPPDSALLRLGRHDGATAGGAFVDELVDAVEELAGPVRLVVDDLQELVGHEAMHDLARLVRRRPATLRLVLSSRADPPLALPRLRMEGVLCELRADTLRFGLTDAARLLRTSVPAITDDQVQALLDNTEGWVAGLRLASIALHGSSDVGRFVAEFSGDERSVADYLAGEVITALSTESLAFLRTVSVCAQPPVELAAALSGRPDAGRALADIGRETALVEHTGSGTYRVHALLRSYLVAGLERHDPALHQRLHATAARWWADAQEPVHALRHAERAADPELLADLIRRTAVGLMLDGEHSVVRRALKVLGPAGPGSDPWLALVAALTEIDERALPAALAHLDRARHLGEETREPGLEILRTSTELIGSALDLVDRSGTPLAGDPPTPELAALLHVGRAAAELGPRGSADLRLARQELDAAVALAMAGDHGYLEVQALTMLASLAAADGDHAHMVTYARSAVDAASRRGRHPSVWTAGASAMLAYADLLAGDPAEAARAAGEILQVPDTIPPDARYTLRVVHGAARADRGDRAAGLAEIRAARADATDVRWPPSLPTALAVLEHRAALQLGNAAAAEEVMGWLADRVGAVGEVLLLRAWAEAAAGRHDNAHTLVQPVLSGQVTTLLAHTPIEALLVDSETALHAGDAAAAVAALDAALVIGAAATIARPFALAGPLTRDILPTRPAARARTPFGERLAAALSVIHADAAVLLSEREMVVLALLPSLLSAGEIAGELRVSVNTVKSHVRSIYSKLGASNRREAVRTAQQRGLLA